MDALEGWRAHACVVGMRGWQRGSAQSVCSCSIHRQVARVWTERDERWWSQRRAWQYAEKLKEEKVGNLVIEESTKVKGEKRQ